MALNLAKINQDIRYTFPSLFEYLIDLFNLFRIFDQHCTSVIDLSKLSGYFLQILSFHTPYLINYNVKRYIQFKDGEEAYLFPFAKMTMLKRMTLEYLANNIVFNKDRSLYQKLFFLYFYLRLQQIIIYFFTSLRLPDLLRFKVENFRHRCN